MELRSYLSKNHVYYAGDEQETAAVEGPSTGGVLIQFLYFVHSSENDERNRRSPVNYNARSAMDQINRNRTVHIFNVLGHRYVLGSVGTATTRQNMRERI